MRLKKILNAILFIVASAIVGFSLFSIVGIYVIGKVHEPLYQPIAYAEKRVENGDIIFQTSQSSQSIPIQLATHSKYSHCGIIYWHHGECYVLEAAKTVCATPLKEFIERGENKHHVVKRLSDAEAIFESDDVTKKMTDLYYSKFASKPYDLYFEWSDDKVYCSELVWKIYKDALGVELGKLQHLSDFDLSSDVVRDKLKERYGEKIPLDELVISPAAIFNSDKLKTIIEN